MKTRNNERNTRKLAEAVMLQTGTWEVSGFYLKTLIGVNSVCAAFS